MATNRLGAVRNGALVLAASLVVHVPGLLIGPSLDASAFDVVGWRLAQGAQLYAGIWDHKPPGTFVIPWAAELMRGVANPWLIIWLASVLATAATGLLAGALLRRAGIERLSVPVALLVTLASGQYLVSLGGGLAEQPATALATGAVLLVAGRDGTWRWLAAGCLLAAGVAVSIQVVPAGAALLVLDWKRDRSVPSFVALLGGGLVLIAIAVVALWVAGVGPAASDAFFAYNAAYRSAPATGASLRALPWATLALVPVLGLAAAGLLALRRVQEARRVGWACAAWVTLGAVLLIVQGRFYAHYMISVVVPLGVLAGIGLSDIVALVTRRPALKGVVGTAGISLCVIAVLASAAGGLQEGRTWGTLNERADAAASRIREVVPSQATILVWGNQPYVYRLSERAPALRYVYLFPLTTPGYSTPELIADTRQELEATPPALVIDAGSLAPGEPGLAPLLIPRPLATEGRDLDLLDPLRDFVRERYELVEVLDGWPIYRLAAER
jgi:hypothetical protein